MPRQNEKDWRARIFAGGVADSIEPIEKRSLLAIDAIRFSFIKLHLPNQSTLELASGPLPSD